MFIALHPVSFMIKEKEKEVIGIHKKKCALL